MHFRWLGLVLNAWGRLAGTGWLPFLSRALPKDEGGQRRREDGGEPLRSLRPKGLMGRRRGRRRRLAWGLCAKDGVSG